MICLMIFWLLLVFIFAVAVAFSSIILLAFWYVFLPIIYLTLIVSGIVYLFDIITGSYKRHRHRVEKE